MSNGACGCGASTCGCCEGTQRLTPADTTNRPGLNALHYRVGVHGQFFESMKARLGTMTVDAPGADQQTFETFRPLTALTTRDTSDPAIALLDGWATVGDVLTFYQERIANEGYLRTATERRSVLELARLTGYALRPGVASTVYLAYTLDDTQVDPVEIPEGARSQTIPGPGETPQSFETAGKFVARKSWNNLQVRLNTPQNIVLSNVLSVSQLYVDGTATNLKAGDKLLFQFGTGTETTYAMRVVSAIAADYDNDWTRIEFQSVPAGIPDATSALSEFIDGAKSLGTVEGDKADGRSYAEAIAIRTRVRLGVYTPPGEWWASMDHHADGGRTEPFKVLEAILVSKIATSPAVGDAAGPVLVTDPSKFVTKLLAPPHQQVRSSAHLVRDLVSQFDQGTDVGAQLVVNFERRLADTYFVAWSNANVRASAPEPELSAVYALRLTASLFGASSAETYWINDAWKARELDSSEANDQVYLDQVYDAIAPGSLVVVQQSDGELDRTVCGVVAADGVQRSAYGLSGKCTRLTLDRDWWEGDDGQMLTLRSTLVYAQSEKLTLIDEPVTEDVTGQELVLDGLYGELKSGRWVIVSGERTDIEGVTGVGASELMMLSGVRHEPQQGTAGGRTLTTLLFATDLAYTYKRSSVVVFGNVVKATHGETRKETLGSGDAAQALQTFVLKQPPVTFIPAANASGVDSTLQVFVNEVEWQEKEALSGAGPGERMFITKTDDADQMSVIFGNGREGARLPSGLVNVRAEYRNGIGKAGNVKAQQISMLQTKPLGVKSVINPLRSSGGADRDSLDQARGNAPLALMALDRLVSLKDYEDFTRTFAGIGKALVKRLSDGRREFVHLTIAGADDAPIDSTSDVYACLLDALRDLGEPDLPIEVDARERVALVLDADIELAPDYEWEDVEARVRKELLERFGFVRRSLAQPALLCEVVAAIQSVRGVAYADVNTFGGIPEIDPDTGALITPDAMSARVQAMCVALDGETPLTRPADAVPAASAAFRGGGVAPAQLVLFAPEIPDTLILNLIV